MNWDNSFSAKPMVSKLEQQWGAKPVVGLCDFGKKMLSLTSSKNCRYQTWTVERVEDTNQI